MTKDSETPPDAYTKTSVAGCANPHDWIREQMVIWRAQGMTHARWTHDEATETLWIDFWKERPVKEAPFTTNRK